LGNSLLGDDFGYADINLDSVIADLEELQGNEAPSMKIPLVEDFIPNSEDLYAEVDSEINPFYNDAFARLDQEAADMRASYEDQLRESSDFYNRQASGLLGNQYRANAQTYDALQSDLRKSRQNALEAGASAGMRLAGNVNALLSAQNKQSQTAMDTSNALAEMLLQQRNAAAGIRSDYRNYMSDMNNRKTDLGTQQRTERENLYAQRYNSKMNDYNAARSDYDTAWENYDRKNANVSDTNLMKNRYLTWQQSQASNR
jgi:hypothetical protein